MSSFSCPHLDEAREFCQRLEADCVPGRPGCVLRKSSVFLVPAAERLRQREQGKALPTSNDPPNQGKKDEGRKGLKPR